MLGAHEEVIAWQRSLPATDEIVRYAGNERTGK